jgi:hypothetical protein
VLPLRQQKGPWSLLPIPTYAVRTVITHTLHFVQPLPLPHLSLQMLGTMLDSCRISAQAPHHFLGPPMPEALVSSRANIRGNPHCRLEGSTHIIEVATLKTTHPLLSIPHLSELLVSPFLCAMQRQWGALTPPYYTMCPKSLNTVKEVLGRLYYGAYHNLPNTIQ